MSERDNTAHREEPKAVSSAMLAHEGGLHARPAIRVAQLAKRFAAQVWIGVSEGGPWVDAKSVSRVLAMKTPNHTRLFFSADGSDAGAAVDALARLVDNDFVPVDAA